jgi:hypothetical protein
MFITALHLYFGFPVNMHSSIVGASHTHISLHAQGGNLKSNDPEVWKIIDNEYKRQCKGIELIASENFISSSVMEVIIT